MKLATLDDHRRFCEVDGWRRRPRPSKHEVWDKHLADGRVLRTAISKGRRQYQKQTFARILRQLEVSEDEFWDAVERRLPPERAGESSAPPEKGPRLPLDVAYRLERELGYTREQLRGMSPEDARKALEGEH